MSKFILWTKLFFSAETTFDVQNYFPYSLHNILLNYSKKNFLYSTLESKLVHLYILKIRRLFGTKFSNFKLLLQNKNDNVILKLM